MFFFTEVTTRSTKIADSRYRFVSRKPFFRSTTTKISTESQDAIDQDKESSNQQSLEEIIENNDTTELGDIAIALQEIQQAPIPTKTTTVRLSTPITQTTRGNYYYFF